MRAEHGLCQTMSDECVGSKNGSGPGTPQLLLSLFVRGASGNDEIRIEHVGGKSHINVFRVVAYRSNQAFGGVYVCPPQCLVLCRVGDKSGNSFVNTPLRPLRIGIDQKDWNATASQFPNHAAADAAGAANDVVVAQFIQHVLSPFAAKVIGQFQFDNEVDHHSDEINTAATPASISREATILP